MDLTYIPQSIWWQGRSGWGGGGGGGTCRCGPHVQMVFEYEEQVYNFHDLKTHLPHFACDKSKQIFSIKQAIIYVIKGGTVKTVNLPQSFRASLHYFDKCKYMISK